MTMQALRNLVSPDRKRIKTQEPMELTDSEEELEEDMVASQHSMMKKMMGMITDIQTSMSSIKDEIAQATFQAGVAQAVAEDAMGKIEELESSVWDKISELETRIPTKDNIQIMIDNAITNINIRAPNVSYAKNNVFANTVPIGTGSTDEKFSRTLVVGGFERDTPNKVIVDYMTDNILKNAQHVEESFAYNIGSVGFVRFRTRDAMFVFLNAFNSKDKPVFNNRPLWITTSKTPEERTKSKHLSKFKKVLIETGLVVPGNATIDYKRGIAFVKLTTSTGSGLPNGIHIYGSVSIKGVTLKHSGARNHKV